MLWSVCHSGAKSWSDSPNLPACLLPRSSSSSSQHACCLAAYVSPYLCEVLVLGVDGGLRDRAQLEQHGRRLLARTA